MGRNWEIVPRSGSCNLCGLACIENQKNKGAAFSAPPLFFSALLRCQFLGLAFVPHQLERPLGLLVRGGDFLLHFGCGLFHLW
jgi:hypothetical protein